MTIIDVLMPAADCEYATVAPEHLEPFRPAFAARGLELRSVPWPEAAGRPHPSAASGRSLPLPMGEGTGGAAAERVRTTDGTVATLALFAWGYHLDVARWEAVLAAWPADRLLFNPPALLAWNTRKTYLRELAERGIPVVPSRFGPADDASVAAAFAAFDCAQIVAKPQVSGGAWLTQRLRPGEPVEPIAEAILQPYLPAVGEEGELSFLFIGGAFSHAVRKVAAPGDFRIQPQFGGRFQAFDPDSADRALAERILAAAPAAPLYARVDLIRLPDGTLALMELEVIEPDLYLDHADDVAGKLADALIGWLARRH